MSDHVVVDVEIAHTIEETPGGWDATDQLDLAVACLWEYKTRRMRVYGPDEIDILRERLLRADRISGYNIWNFDFPVIWGFSRSEWAHGEKAGASATVHQPLKGKTNDLLRRIWQALGFDPDGGWQEGMGGAKLDDIAGATLGVHKIGQGVSAPKWYQMGKIQRVVNYCADDTCLERDLVDFVDRYGYVYHNGKQLFLKR